MILSKRLSAIAGMVTKGKRAADVGCDHGYVPIWLVENGISPSAQALDVKAGPLERAKEHIRQHGLEDRIITKQSNGLEKYEPGEADSLIIAGMGGALMSRILKENETKAKSFCELILSPQSDFREFRRFLIDSGYKIIYERMVEEDGKYYFILFVLPTPDERKWSEAQLCFGKNIMEEDLPCLKSYLERTVRAKAKLCRDMEKNLETKPEDSEKLRLRIAEVKKELSYVEERLDSIILERNGD